MAIRTRPRLPRQLAIAKARKDKGMQSQELAAILNVRRADLSAYENGHKRAGPVLMMRWADALGVPVSAWTFWEDHPVVRMAERLIAEQHKNCEGAS